MHRYARYVSSICAALLCAGCGDLGEPRGAVPPAIVAPAAIPQTIGDPVGSYQVIHRFDSTGGGANPDAPLLSLDDTLYGTTSDTQPCRPHGCGSGTVYRISPSGVKKVLHRFKGGVFDGAMPVGALVAVNGVLYGVTARGGGKGCGQGCGTVYSMSTNGSEKVLYAFKGGGDGSRPAGLVAVNGTLYGTTLYGGGEVSCGGLGSTSGCGTVYRLTMSGHEKILHDFSGRPDGAQPNGQPIDVNGVLYGTTSSGGVACGTRTVHFTLGCGTIYRITMTGSERVLHRFKGSFSDIVPTGGLLSDGSRLYGTTANALAPGAVYAMSLSGVYTVLYDFKGHPDGASPNAGLIEANGILYGTTQQGGTICMRTAYFGCGTIFGVTTGGKERVLYRFTGKENGKWPSAGLIALSDRLYGTTTWGGNAGCDEGCGTVFRASP